MGLKHTLASYRARPACFFGVTSTDDKPLTALFHRMQKLSA
jgi:hypothetical protein